MPERTLTQSTVPKPDALIRGVTSPIEPVSLEAKICHSIDWLAYTVPWDLGWKSAFPQHEALTITGEVLPNLKGYDTRIALTHGSVSFHTRYPLHKIYLLFRGADLAALRRHGLDPLDLIVFPLAQAGGALKRLDFAVDYFAPSSPRDLHDAWAAKALKSPSHKCNFTQSSDRTKDELTPAYTTYIGQPASHRMLRCYDKAAERGVPGPWTRIELQTRDECAHRLGRGIRAEGIECAGKQAIRDFVQCEVAWFNQAIAGPSVYLEPGERKTTNTKRWLLEQVLPALVRQIAADAAVGETALRDIFLEKLLTTLATN